MNVDAAGITWKKVSQEEQFSMILKKHIRQIPYKTTQNVPVTSYLFIQSQRVITAKILTMFLRVVYYPLSYICNVADVYLHYFFKGIFDLEQLFFTVA